jgi:hypothetical protein
VPEYDRRKDPGIFGPCTVARDVARTGLTSTSGTVWWLRMSTAPPQFLLMTFAG